MYKLLLSWASIVLGFIEVLLLVSSVTNQPAHVSAATVAIGETPFHANRKLIFAINEIDQLRADRFTFRSIQKKTITLPDKNQINENSKVIALSFDDGPSKYTPQILEILKKYNIRATFFILGQNAEANPHLVKQIHSEGHIVGNHSWAHPELIKLSTAQILSQIESTNQVIEKITGQRPHLFRAPYGSLNATVRSAIQSSGMTSVLWNVDPADWNIKLATSIVDRVQSGLKQKNLLLLHDGGGPRDNTVASLPSIIEKLQQQGYQFVTVPEYLSLQK